MTRHQIMLKRWKNKKYRKAMSKKVSKTVKKRWSDGTYSRKRPKHSKVMREKWKDPSYSEPLLAKRRTKKFRKRAAIAAKALWKDKDWSARNCLTRKTNWKKPDYREKYREGHIRGARKRVEDPNFLRKVAKACSKHPNKPEIALIGMLDSLDLDYKFQKPLLGFIPDFTIEKKRIIECDGKYWHSLPEVVSRDRRKHRKFKKEGYRVLRVDADKVIKKPILVRRQIIRFLFGPRVHDAGLTPEGCIQ